MHIWSILLLLRISAALGSSNICPSLEFRVCGNYCGPGFCSGQQIATSQCLFEAEPTSCADACCREHDRCCDTEETGSCNREMVQCITACGAGDTCDLNGIAIPNALVVGAMRLMSDWCCDKPCDVGAAVPTCELPFDFLSSIIESVQTPAGSWAPPTTTSATMLGCLALLALQVGAAASVYVRHIRFRKKHLGTADKAAAAAGDLSDSAAARMIKLRVGRAA